MDRSSAAPHARAVLRATTALVAEHGPAGITMSRIAQRTGIGRATPYRYYSDVEVLLTAWHARQVAEGAAAGDLRDDVPPDELAGYVIGTLPNAGALHSEAAVRRLVAVILAGLRPDRPPGPRR